VIRRAFSAGVAACCGYRRGLVLRDLLGRGCTGKMPVLRLGQVIGRGSSAACGGYRTGSVLRDSLGRGCTGKMPVLRWGHVFRRAFSAGEAACCGYRMGSVLGDLLDRGCTGKMPVLRLRQAVRVRERLARTSGAAEHSLGRSPR